MDRGVCKVQVLLQVTQGVFLGNVDGTAVQAFLPENHLEQGGLSTTITAYQAHALMVAHKQACPVQENLDSEGLGDILYLDHCPKIAKKGIYPKFYKKD